MISRTYTRKALKEALLESTLTDGCKYRYPMASFRHAIFEIVDSCKCIRDIKFYLDIDNKLSMCTFFYLKTEINCVYDFKGNKVMINKGDKNYSVNIEEFVDLLKKIQPVCKIKVKKNNSI